MAALRFTGTPQSYILPHSAKAGDPYTIGNIYQRLRSSPAVKTTPDPWSAPYLARLTEVSRRWPYMQYLVDWMNTTCSPPKWNLLAESDKAERASRVKMCFLEFPLQQKMKRTDLCSVAELHECLRKYRESKDTDTKCLFVVEDLSRDVIEALGNSLDIDPRFFRSHIGDYLWYNTQDPWIELPELEIHASKRDFFHVRYVQPRYFRNDQVLRNARIEAGSFNVLRRVDVEPDRVSKLDEPGSLVGMVRSKAALWSRPKDKDGHGSIGVLLLDPPITEGLPLWGGYSYFADHDGMYLNDSPAKPHWTSTSIFDDFIYWTEHMQDSELLEIDRDPRVFATKALMMITSNWKVTLEYATTRLTQVEWEVENPALRDHPDSDGLEGCLRRLHRWRRVLPIYHSMVSHALSSVIQRGNSRPGEPSSLKDLQPDYEKILDQISNLQIRAERIVTLVGTLISIEENKKAVEQNGNLTRLTYLASFFIPMTFLTSFFSMTSDLASLKQTFWIYFVVAVPLTATCLFITLYLYSDRMLLTRYRRS